VQFISWAEYWYNTNYQRAAKCTPFEVVYGKPPPSIARYIPGETKLEAVAQDLMNRDEALKQLKFHLQRAQDPMSKFANKHKKSSIIKVRDEVYLKVRLHKQQSMSTTLHPKLSAHYYGPFVVIAQVGPVAYRLQLPRGSINSLNLPCFSTQMCNRKGTGRIDLTTKFARNSRKVETEEGVANQN